MGGQLFGLLVGFGLAMLKKTIGVGADGGVDSEGNTLSYAVEFPLFKFTEADGGSKDNLLDVIVLFTALLTLCLTYIYGRMKSYKYDKPLAYILGVIYFAFVAIAT